MNIQTLIRLWTEKIAQENLDSPRLSAELVMGKVLSMNSVQLVMNHMQELTECEHAEFSALMERRLEGEPVAYLLGVKEFYALDFMVTPATLIPRPETEHIIEAVCERFNMNADFSFADLGTGSGAIGVTLAVQFASARGTLVDLSGDALAVAKQNGISHGVEGRLSFVQGDFTTLLFADNSLDLIVSNPPYVTEQEFDDASHEVTAYEPTAALVSGVDGLDAIREMLPRVSSALRSGGIFLMEMGWKQGESMKELLVCPTLNFLNVGIIQDLAGHDRIMVAEKR